MGRWGLVVACVAVVYGCAVPVPVRVASWAIEGLTYLATEKTIADHGLSFVAKKDCSILRGVTRKQLCIDGAPRDTAVAAADGGEAESGAPGDVEVAVTSLADVDGLDDFETAAGPAPDPGAPQPQALVAPETQLAELGSGESAPPVASSAADRDATGDLAIAKLSAAVPPRRPPWQPQAARARVGTGFYYVVGSFRYLDNAQSLAERHALLAPTIVEARLDGRTHFRVVVGPFERLHGKTLRRRLRRAGITDAWAIALNPVNWSVARNRAASPPEVASAQAAR